MAHGAGGLVAQAAAGICFVFCPRMIQAGIQDNRADISFCNTSVGRRGTAAAALVLFFWRLQRADSPVCAGRESKMRRFSARLQAVRQWCSAMGLGRARHWVRRSLQ